MTAKIIDGRAFAAGILAEVAAETSALAASGLVPGLAVVLVGEDAASEVYVRNKARATKEAGMASFEYRLPADSPEAALLALVSELNDDPAVHGILVQLPLPRHIDSARVLDAISPDKDVDGFHVINAGRLATGLPGLVPCTPLGCLLMLRAELGDLSGARAVVLGRSNIVGKPMAALLLRESCTVRSAGAPISWWRRSAGRKWYAATGSSRVRRCSTWASTVWRARTAAPAWLATWLSPRRSRSPGASRRCRAALGR
jgi:methylenetetrahydrofolate dehydrogenase (NADP+)/methenyltetrahydrofolate cyclohydrolase